MLLKGANMRVESQLSGQEGKPRPRIASQALASAVVRPNGLCRTIDRDLLLKHLGLTSSSLTARKTRLVEESVAIRERLTGDTIGYVTIVVKTPEESKGHLHRIFIGCPECGKLVNFGHFSQHARRRDHWNSKHDVVKEYLRFQDVLSPASCEAQGEEMDRMAETDK
jgi:hypothetical protein